MQQQEWKPVEATETGWSWRKRLIMGCLALVVVLSMLASAIGGGFWLWQSWQERQTVAQERVVSSPTAVATETAATSEPVAETSVETAVATTAATATTIPVPHNRIAFINQRGQVETMAPDGSERRQLTDTDQRFQFPAWSPTTSNLAVVGGNRNGAGVYVLQDESGAGEPQERYFSRTQSPFYLYWSPDGNFISFLSNHFESSIALRLAPVAGEEEDRILATGSPFYWHWIGDSATILIHSDAGGEEPRLALINAEGDDEVEQVAQPGLFQSPGVSADGRFWAYATEQAAGLSWLTILNNDNGETYDQRHAGVLAMGWSPTRNQIAAISGPPESDEFFGPLRLLDVETGEGRMLSQETVLAFFWSPDGRYLAYISSSIFDDDIQVNSRQKRPAKRVPVQNTSIEFRLHILDVETGEDRQLLTFQPTFTFLSQFLPFFDQYAHSHQLWAPDSSALVLPIREDRDNKIVVIPIDGEPIQELAEGDMPFWSQY